MIKRDTKKVSSIIEEYSEEKSEEQEVNNFVYLIENIDCVERVENESKYELDR